MNHRFCDVLMNDAATKAVSVVLRADEILAESLDPIVFPEGISWVQIGLAAVSHPNAVIIVGGVDEGGRIRGVLWHAEANRIDSTATLDHCQKGYD